MKQRKNIEKVVSTIYDKLLIEKRNNSQKQIISNTDFLKLARSKNNIFRGKKIIVLLSEADVIFSDRKILIGDYEENKNLRSLC